MSFSFEKHLEYIGAELVRAFEYASNASTPGLVGDVREHTVRSNLSSLLGNLVEVGEGCVIDSEGQVSNQQDVIVTERSLAFGFPVAGSIPSTYYPCEVVIAAGEVKSRMGIDELKDAIVKSTSVKNLTRKQRYGDNISGQSVSLFRRIGSSQTLAGTPEEQFNPISNAKDQIFTFCLARDIKIRREKVISEYIQCRDEGRWFPDILVGLNGFVAIHVSQLYGRNMHYFSQTEAQGLLICECASPFTYLLKVIRQFLGFARTVPVEAMSVYFQSKLSEKQDYGSYFEHLMRQRGQ